MHNFAKHIILIITILSAAVISSCEKENKILPVLETLDVWNVSQRVAFSGGYVIYQGGTPILARGVCWSKTSGPTIKDNHTTEIGNTESFWSTLNGLTAATTYYVRAYATNKYGTGYGNEVTFQSGPVQIPEIGTDRVSSITATSAASGGIIYYDGGSIVTSNGVCWSTDSSPTLEDPHSVDESVSEHYFSLLNGLTGNTTYYLRAYAINSAGTAYGNELTFKTYSDSAANVLFSPIIFNSTLTYGTVRDADWNVYKTVQIGGQTWMAENLKTITFNTGEQIANVDDKIFWPDYTLDAYCWYKNDISYKTSYGALYNWYTIKTGKLCPKGWHVPSKEEFTSLTTFLGGESTAGIKLKESGTIHWMTPNDGAANESGFSALPGGYLSPVDFISFRTAGYWWSSTESNSGSASYLLLQSDNNSTLITAGNKAAGMSVRCIKN